MFQELDREVNSELWIGRTHATINSAEQKLMFLQLLLNLSVSAIAHRPGRVPAIEEDAGSFSQLVTCVGQRGERKYLAVGDRR